MRLSETETDGKRRNKEGEGGGRCASDGHAGVAISIVEESGESCVG